MEGCSLRGPEITTASSKLKPPRADPGSPQRSGVISRQQRDPVGACVGMKVTAFRLSFRKCSGRSTSFRGRKTPQPLSSTRWPATVSRVVIDEDENRIKLSYLTIVYASLAIGRRGQGNILASGTGHLVSTSMTEQESEEAAERFVQTFRNVVPEGAALTKRWLSCWWPRLLANWKKLLMSTRRNRGY
jgi:hypothetical protein